MNWGIPVGKYFKLNHLYFPTNTTHLLTLTFLRITINFQLTIIYRCLIFNAWEYTSFQRYKSRHYYYLGMCSYNSIKLTKYFIVHKHEKKYKYSYSISEICNGNERYINSYQRYLTSKFYLLCKLPAKMVIKILN